MTNEELIEMLNILLDNAKIGCADITVIKYISLDSFKFVIEQTIQALSQELCDDAISREWLMRKATERFYTTNYFNHITKMIEEAPSVTQKPNFCASCKHNTDNEICLECEYDGITRGMTRYESVTQKSGKWIPFSERLPKPFEHCLITTTDGEVIYHYDDGHYSKYKAWMPLPKPYEPQESEDKV